MGQGNDAALDLGHLVPTPPKCLGAAAREGCWELPGGRSSGDGRLGARVVTGQGAARSTDALRPIDQFGQRCKIKLRAETAGEPATA